MLQLQPWARLQRMCAPSLSGSTPVLFHNFPQQRQQRSHLLHDGRRYAAVVIRSCASSARPSPWLLVGLGNPGSKYQGTRHNVGFEMIDAIAQAENISLTTIQHKALLGKGYVGGVPVLLAKPQTYMNLSGESVGPLSTYYKIPVERVLVIYDDLDLEFAVMRLLPKGGHGGHNGMKNLMHHFKGSREFPRMRIGIGRPTGTMDPRAYVLQKFSSSEREELDASLQRGIEGVRLLTEKGLERAVSTWNQYRKSKLASIQEL
ncbi:unnamed protein product [Sphagnum balticum]